MPKQSQVSSRELTVPSEPLTVEALKAVMPKRQKHNITDSLVNELNQLITDPDEREMFRNNLLSYTSVLEDPGVKLTDYVSAVRYVGYQLMGYTNQDAWIKTFPDRYNRMIKRKQISEEDNSHLRSTVGCYNRGKVVNAVREQTLIPSWILNADIHQKAINQLARLMVGAKSEKVQADSATALLTHLKMPEALKVKLDVEVKENDEIRELRRATLELVEEQKRAISSGARTADQIAEAKLINGEYERVGED